MRLPLLLLSVYDTAILIPEITSVRPDDDGGREVCITLRGGQEIRLPCKTHADVRDLAADITQDWILWMRDGHGPDEGASA